MELLYSLGNRNFCFYSGSVISGFQKRERCSKKSNLKYFVKIWLSINEWLAKVKNTKLAIETKLTTFLKWCPKSLNFNFPLDINCYNVINRFTFRAILLIFSYFLICLRRKIFYLLYTDIKETPTIVFRASKDYNFNIFALQIWRNISLYR